MKAMVFEKYGDVDVLQIKEIETPQPSADEVLIKVFATSVNPVDWKIRKGVVRLFFPTKKFPRIVGFDVSGEIAGTGAGVTRFKPGDRVYGLLDLIKDCANAEYVVTKAEYLSIIPAKLGYSEAAAIPLAALTALQSLKDLGHLKAGENVLIIGASGGVGSFAVPIAKALGAHVTGICSGKNVSIVKALGADDVIAYDQQEIKNEAVFDIVFDAVAVSSFFKMRKRLKPGGRYLTTLPSPSNVLSKVALPVMRVFGSKKQSIFSLVKPGKEGMEYLSQLVEEGKLTSLIDRVYPLEALAEAHRYSETGRVKGKIVIEVVKK
jgi:NADPH:quinone reductase-like Zn-dependent oxidoreductase